MAAPSSSTSSSGRRFVRRSHRWTRWVPLAAVVWLGVAAVGPIQQAPSDPAHTPSVPSGPRTIGFDISYPQCPWERLPPGKFGIVGLNRGRPFTLNPCMERLYAWAARSGTPSVYVNVAFDPSYSKHLTTWCRANVPAALTKPRPRLAWAVGCSEAAYALANTPGPAHWWWLDVETANSWGGRKANRTTITAAVAFLRRFASTPVGIYSTQRSWWLITGFGTWNPPGATANWLGVDRNRTARTAAGDCGTGFSGMPVTLVQFYRHGGIGTWDANWAC